MRHAIFFKNSNSKNVADQIPLQTYKQQTQIDTNHNLPFYMNPASNGRNLFSMSKMSVGISENCNFLFNIV